VSAPGLRRFTAANRPAAPARPVPGERCEFCTEPVPDEHRHVADLHGHTIACACTGCWLLFSAEGAGGGRYRAVPDRYRYCPDVAVAWDDLGVPVDLIFVFRSTTEDRYVALYPSPAGATESLLPMDVWAEVVAASPFAADVQPDVEAVLLRRTGGRVEGFLVPIDACYDLVGRVRVHWRGFDGGERVWQELDAFFRRLVARAGG
jgi:Family of unknown function (DUF5947)